jgi:hypothetical protein
MDTPTPLAATRTITLQVFTDGMGVTQIFRFTEAGAPPTFQADASSVYGAAALLKDILLRKRIDQTG